MMLMMCESLFVGIFIIICLTKCDWGEGGTNWFDVPNANIFINFEGPIAKLYVLLLIFFIRNPLNCIF